MLNLFSLIITVILVITSIGVVLIAGHRADFTPPVTTNTASPNVVATLTDPLSNARARITKKFFGTYVTPKNSPVQPERFTGFHTGVDLETYSNEQSVDVPVNAVCDGTLALVESASGYGGVVVERCTISGEAVTVIYGHVRMTSISKKVGATMRAGESFAVLGTGFSSETDGERKHLHLDIHRGNATNIRGYVSKESDLANWIDPLPLLGT